MYLNRAIFRGLQFRRKLVCARWIFIRVVVDNFARRSSAIQNGGVPLPLYIPRPNTLKTLLLLCSRIIQTCLIVFCMDYFRQRKRVSRTDINFCMCGVRCGYAESKMFSHSCGMVNCVFAWSQPSAYGSLIALIRICMCDINCVCRLVDGKHDICTKII